MTAIPLADRIWYRIYDHPAFDPEMAYRALAYLCFGDTAWAQLLFTTEQGHTVGVQVHRCTALPAGPDSVDSSSRYRLLSKAEFAFPRAGKFTNPDVGTDL